MDDDIQNHSLSISNKLNNDDCELSQKDFCPPFDYRCVHSIVFDISGGDTFFWFIEELIELYEEEEVIDFL